MSRLSVLSLSLVLALGACGGDSGTGPDDTTPGDTDNTESRVVKANPSFAADIQEIFNRRGCASSACHGASQQAGLNLQAGSSYGNLVNVMSTEVNLNRVVPFDPGNSYLVRKVEGTASFGGRMPLGGSALDDIDITNIKNWISTGALNN